MIHLSSRLMAIALALAMLCLGAPALAGSTTTYRDARMGLSLELPANWVPPEKTQDGALIFSGPKGTPSYRTTIALQMVTASKTDSLRDQERQVLGQWKTAPGYKLLAQREGTLAGSPAARLEAEYLLPKDREPFRQEQYVVQRPGHFLWMGYTAPRELYAGNHPIMDQAINSLKFTTASAQGQAQPRVYEVTACSAVIDGKPKGAASVFPDGIAEIYIWFRFRDVTPGSYMVAVWYKAQNGKLRPVGQSKTQVGGESHWGDFHVKASKGHKLPPGDFRVDIYVGKAKEASASFTIR